VSLHTRATLVDDVVARVDGDRPDAVPFVVVTQLIDGHPDYLQWIIYETAGAVDRRAATDARRTVRAGGRWHWGHSRQGHARRRGVTPATVLRPVTDRTRSVFAGREAGDRSG
jgi:hypothetical protein